MRSVERRHMRTSPCVAVKLNSLFVYCYFDMAAITPVRELFHDPRTNARMLDILGPFWEGFSWYDRDSANYNSAVSRAGGSLPGNLTKYNEDTWYDPDIGYAYVKSRDAVVYIKCRHYITVNTANMNPDEKTRYRDLRYPMAEDMYPFDKLAELEHAGILGPRIEMPSEFVNMSG